MIKQGNCGVNCSPMALAAVLLLGHWGNPARLDLFVIVCFTHTCSPTGHNLPVSLSKLFWLCVTCYSWTKTHKGWSLSVWTFCFCRLKVNVCELSFEIMSSLFIKAIVFCSLVVTAWWWSFACTICSSCLYILGVTWEEYIWYLVNEQDSGTTCRVWRLSAKLSIYLFSLLGSHWQQTKLTFFIQSTSSSSVCPGPTGYIISSAAHSLVCTRHPNQTAESTRLSPFNAMKQQFSALFLQISPTKETCKHYVMRVT